jgi:hypothetical protein
MIGSFRSKALRVLWANNRQGVNPNTKDKKILSILSAAEAFVI